MDQTVIKDSDIERDIRLTGFLNGAALDFSEAERRKSAQRLIDQSLLNKEIEDGDYPHASEQETIQFRNMLEKQRYGGESSKFDAALAKYGVSEDALRDRIGRELTVLRFIELRFRPAVLVTGDDAQRYAAEHPNETPEQAKEQLTGERVNQEFETWLAARRKRAQIEYHEAGLQ